MVKLCGLHVWQWQWYVSYVDFILNLISMIAHLKEEQQPPFFSIRKMCVWRFGCKTASTHKHLCNSNSPRNSHRCPLVGSHTFRWKFMYFSIWKIIIESNVSYPLISTWKWYKQRCWGGKRKRDHEKLALAATAISLAYSVLLNVSYSIKYRCRVRNHFYI